MSKFNLRKALRKLDIEVKPFGYQGTGAPAMDAARQDITRGYSLDRWLAINPNERWPEFVTFHEMAHIILGHTVLHHKMSPEAFYSHKRTNHDLNETECHVAAIMTALVTKAPFDMNGELEHLHFGYTKGRDVPEEILQRASEVSMIIAEAGGM